MGKRGRNWLQSPTALGCDLVSDIVCQTNDIRYVFRDIFICAPFLSWEWREGEGFSTQWLQWWRESIYSI